MPRQLAGAPHRAPTKRTQVAVREGISSLSTQAVDKPVQQRFRWRESVLETAGKGRIGGKTANRSIPFPINGLGVKHLRNTVPRVLRCGVNDTAMTTVHNRPRGIRA
jgi:hypothetical protein